jgi:hypothetical protein
MGNKVLAVMAAAIFLLAASAAWATPTINIYDTGEGAPNVELVNWNGDTPSTNTAVEYVHLKSIFFGIPLGTYGIKMLEPPGEPSANPVSDFAVLVSYQTQVFTTTFNWIDLAFVSDGATNFDVRFGDDLIRFATFAAAVEEFDEQIPGAPTIMEDGSLQTLFNFSPMLQVNAQSDVVPIPGSAILLGTGLLGLVPAWRWRRRA